MRRGGRSLAVGAALGLLFTLAGGLGGCRQEGPADQGVSSPKRASGAVDSAAPTQPTQPTQPTSVLPETQRLAILATLKAMSVRRDCNRVMGCKPAAQLLGHGPGAIGLVGELIVNNPKLDKWWLTKAVDIIGQMGDERAVAVLVPLLTDRRPELRARAGLGLARLGFSSARSGLLKAWEAPTTKADPGTAGAIAYALHRTAPARVRAKGIYREAYLAQWPGSKEAMHKMMAPIIGILAEIAKEWPVRRALPLVRLALAHPSSFARIEALRAVAVLRDQQAIPQLVRRLDDPLPSQRRAAIAALQAIVGNRHLTTEMAWKSWCDQRRCLGKTSKSEVGPK